MTAGSSTCRLIRRTTKTCGSTRSTATSSTTISITTLRAWESDPCLCRFPWLWRLHCRRSKSGQQPLHHQCGDRRQFSCFNDGATCGEVTALTKTTNTLMTVSAAMTQGYTASENFVYSPAVPSDSTVGAGTNEDSLATGSLAALASGTTYACSVSDSNQVVCPSRKSLARGGDWNTGAYQYCAGSACVPLDDGGAVRDGAVLSTDGSASGDAAEVGGGGSRRDASVPSGSDGGINGSGGGIGRGSMGTGGGCGCRSAGTTHSLRSVWGLGLMGLIAARRLRKSLASRRWLVRPETDVTRNARRP
jgi:MYXO-CTERM domain-containing protein